MRLWSVHPVYLDAKGLVAVWREGLLALHVLRGQTKGYTHHPQLKRFREHPQPILALSSYLHVIADEADQRSYQFKREKLAPRQNVDTIPLTQGQLYYEVQHLLRKLEKRDLKRHALYQGETLTPHPLFEIIEGGVEPWEKLAPPTANTSWKNYSPAAHGSGT